MKLRPRHLLLAALLATSAWWFLTWFLAVRPVYTLRFPVHETAKQQRRSQSVSSFEREPCCFGVRPFDVAGWYFLVDVPEGNAMEKWHLEVRETTSGRLAGTIDLPVLASKSHPGQPGRDQLAILAAITEGRRFGSDGTLPILDGKQVWQLNVLTGGRRLLGEVPNRRESRLSADGSTLVYLDSLSSADWRAVTRREYEDLPIWRCCRVLSLPSLEERYSFEFQVTASAGRGCPLCSKDGTWVYYLHDIQQIDAHANAVVPSDVGKSPVRQHLHVVNTRTGTTSDLAVPFGVRFDRLHVLPGPFVRATMAEGSAPHDTILERHGRLPAGPWFEPRVSSVDAGQGHTHVAEFSRLELTTLDILDISPDGTTSPVYSQKQEHMFNFQLIPGHSYFTATRHVEDIDWPDWVPGWFVRLPIVQDVLEQRRYRLTITDYSTGQELWKTSFTRTIANSKWGNRFRLVVMPNHVVETHLEGDQHVVNVLALPLRRLSIWWACGGGLGVFVLVLFVRRWRGVAKCA
jgi:hypothetical protein